MTPDQAYRKVLRIVGGVKELARLLGTTSQAVYLWNGVIPEKNVQRVVSVTRRAAAAWGREVKKLPTKQDLRPDLFPPAVGTKRRNPTGAKNGKAKEDRAAKEEGKTRASGETAADETRG